MGEVTRVWFPNSTTQICSVDSFREDVSHGTAGFSGLLEVSAQFWFSMWVAYVASLGIAYRSLRRMT